jgi:hypothetical protein
MIYFTKIFNQGTTRMWYFEQNQTMYIYDKVLNTITVSKSNAISAPYWADAPAVEKNLQELITYLWTVKEVRTRGVAS